MIARLLCLRPHGPLHSPPIRKNIGPEDRSRTENATAVDVSSSPISILFDPHHRSSPSLRLTGVVMTAEQDSHKAAQETHISQSERLLRV